jgi:CubicO group peptidase (beta-lactamase class C family)
VVRRSLLTVLALFALSPTVAQAATSCPEPGEQWPRATPEQAGMAAQKLQEALDYGTSQLSFAVRVYRHGCLVGEDRAAPQNRTQTYESWSLAKSVTSMVFGRAMTLGLISPDDVVGSLVPEADGPHGQITMRDLLTMTSGLRWNGLRDYNIFTMPDRVRDALTLDVVRPHGTYFEYAQSAVTLLGEAVERATGEDFERFAQRELMDRLGIRDENWHWVRDRAGNVAAFMGVNMRPDDFGRLGELMRRDGMWRGKRLLSRRYLGEALAPSATNGCYGWLIWLNAGSPCIGPTIQERPVSDNREWPDLPKDLYRFSGLFGQLVTVLPAQGIVVVRTGQDPGLAPTGGTGWEHDLYAKILASVTDQRVEPAGDAKVAQDRPNADYGFQTSIREPDQYRKGLEQDPLPAAGPARARALWTWLAFRRVSRKGIISVRAACYARWPGREAPPCEGVATLEGTRRPVRYRLQPGTKSLLRFTLANASRRSLARAGTARLRFRARNTDAAEGVETSHAVTVARPLPDGRRTQR